MTIEEKPILGEAEKKLRRWLEDPQMDVAMSILRGQIAALEVEAIDSVMSDLHAAAGQLEQPQKAKELIAQAAALRIAVRELESLVGKQSFQLVRIT